MAQGVPDAERLQALFEAIRDGRTADLVARGTTPSVFGAGTPNQAGLRITIAYLEAMLGLPGTSKAAATALIGRFFDAQDRCLFSLRAGGGHEIAPPSHRNYWDSIFLGLHLGAIIGDDRAIYQRSLAAVRAELALCHLCSFVDQKTKTYAVASPGTRGIRPGGTSTSGTAGKGLSLWRNAATDMLYDLARTGKVRRPRAPFWGDRYFTGVSILRHLVEKFPSEFRKLCAPGSGKLLPGVGQIGPWATGDLPAFSQPMHVRRSGRGHVAWFPVLSGLEVQWATWFLDGQPGWIGWTPEAAPRWVGGKIPYDPPHLDGEEIVVGPRSRPTS